MNDLVALDAALAATASDPVAGVIAGGLIPALAGRGQPLAALDAGVDFLLASLLAGDFERFRPGVAAVLELVAAHDWPATAVAPALLPGRLLLAGSTGLVVATVLLEVLGRRTEAVALAAGVDDPGAALLAVWLAAQAGDWPAAAAWAERARALAGRPGEQIAGAGMSWSGSAGIPVARAGGAGGTPAPAPTLNASAHAPSERHTGCSEVATAAGELAAEACNLAERALTRPNWRAAAVVLELVAPAEAADRLLRRLAEAAVAHHDVDAALAYLGALAGAAEAGDQYDRAVELRRLMVELAPTNAGARRALAKACRAAGLVDEAAEHEWRPEA